MQNINEEKYQAAFDIILKAGDARSDAMIAIEKAKEFNFIEAKKYLEQAENKMVEAHNSQTSIIQEEAQGVKIDVNVILVHAQDHFSMAVMAIDFAKQFIDLYELIAKQKEERRVN